MPRSIYLLALLFACSEYGVKQDQDPVDAPTTGAPTPTTTSSPADTGITFTWGTGTATGSGAGTGVGTGTGTGGGTGAGTGGGTGGTGAGTGGGGTGSGGTGAGTGGGGTTGTGTGAGTGAGTGTGSGTGTGTGTGDLLGGHFDVDTSSFIADIGNGDTDAHVHEYDDTHLVSGIDAFVFHEQNLHEIFEDITDPDQRFKILVLNADLSVGGRLVINDVYSALTPRTWTPVVDYDNTSEANLDVFTLSGLPGTRELRELGLYFDPQAIFNRELVPTQTGCVKGNDLGVNGSWRNGALTLQAVAVDANGVDAFTTDASLSQGGHGAATSGLLWEVTIFWHWSGPCSHDPGWATYIP